jgi:predicted Ser/Thr protein kinase
MDNPYAAADPLTMKKLGKYRLEKKIGEGGMGAVYLAKDGLGKEVAVKVLPPQLAADPEYLERFLREIRTMHAVDHPNVVKVLDAGESEKLYFLVMEYVEGKRLSDVIAEQKRMPFDRAARVIREIAKGLEAAHGKGVVHRDVKPQNVLLTRDGKPRLIDFGLAREPGKNTGLTQEGTMMGTPEYMSPEQVEGKKADLRSDIYSLGITFYQLVSGKLPFNGENQMQMAMARIKDEPRDIRNSFPGIDPRAIPLIAKMLAKEPGSRQQSMADVIAEIEKSLAGKGTFKPASKASGGAAVAVDSRRRIRLALLWILAAAGGGLLFAAGLKSGTNLQAAVAGAHRNLIYTLAGAGAGAVILGLIIAIKDLVTSGRVVETPLTVLVAVAICGAAGAMIGNTTLEAIATPVNRVALALFIIALGAAVAFRGAKPIATDLCSFVAAALFYWAGARSGIFEPFQALGGKPELAIPLMIGGLFVPIFGAVLVSGEDRKPGTRLLGMILLLVGCVGLAAFAALTPLGGFRWTIEGVVAALKGAQSSGAAVIGAVALGLIGILRIQTGLERSDAYYGR